ncbi:Dihydrofolate reductase [Ceratobasidium theobromae]|uniref:Dihydrofolate reductase n=1 Tax=Ceratobasidium theobromae TaxID=1582974 RepID=A0A5N5QR63_9AGAM|nr:Dihydrofolate reductase [Ceratobasidium theobromae]
MPPQITVIVAATLSNGIGVQGTLPWRLPREMAYFARVTREGGPPSESSNAVIMGRKTWDGIPPKFRPLKDRTNVVISNSMTVHAQDERQPTHVAPSIDGALSILSSTPIRNAFIIGGMSIYDQALKHPSTTRILLTRILHPEYDACDAFFPEIRNTGEWARAHHTDLESWLGFEVPSGVQQENQTEYEFQMWVRAIPSTIN